MAQAVRGKLIGDTAHLALEVIWPTNAPDDLAALGWGDVVLWFAGQRHWVSDKDDPADGEDNPVRWTWVDLVEHLARSWSFLLYEENAPYGLVADAPENLRDPRLLKSVAERSETEVEDAVHAFQHRHDLAAGLKGIWLPPVWLIREGRMMRVRAGDQDAWFPVHDVLRILEEFVDEVLQHSPSDLSERRARAEEAWNSRAPDPETVWRLRTGLTWQTIRDWTPNGLEPSEWWGDPLSEEESPLMAAARLSAPLSEDTRRTLVGIIRELAASSTDVLDDLTASAEAVLEAVLDEKPYRQGYALALWLRRHLKVNEDPVDPEQILRQWGVHVADLPHGLDMAMDAIACWGGGKGPAVLINVSGTHAHSPGGRRATLAHEIAHLLLDRHRHLPLVEVFGGSTPLHLEQRARAFAAEFLLPRETAARIVARSDSLDSATKIMRRQYGVSTDVAGWQIKNGPGWQLLNPAEQSQVMQWRRPWSSTIGGSAAEVVAERPR